MFSFVFCFYFLKGSMTVVPAYQYTYSIANQYTDSRTTPCRQLYRGSQIKPEAPFTSLPSLAQRVYVYV